MGQVAPIDSGNGRVLSDIEMKALAYLAWIKKNLGGTREMVPYLTAMLSQEIWEGPVLQPNIGDQFSLEEAGLSLSDGTS